VYGEVVTDFKHLQESAISTLSTAALQEVDRIQQQHDAQIADLESQLQEQTSENQALRTALESLESRIESLESVVD
jgi:septal ring factor EnvC (AmiA/AmiB activator)